MVSSFFHYLASDLYNSDSRRTKVRREIHSRRLHEGLTFLFASSLIARFSPGPFS